MDGLAGVGLRGELFHAMFRLRNLQLQWKEQHVGLSFGRRSDFPSRGAGLSMPEFVFLKRLLERDEAGERGGALLSEMRDYLCVSKAAVSQMMGSLEGRGLIRREADPGDRRTIIVEPTDEGRELVRGMERRFDEHVDLLLERFGEADAREAIRLIDKFAVIVEEMKSEGHIQ